MRSNKPMKLTVACGAQSLSARRNGQRVQWPVQLPGRDALVIGRALPETV
jgi:hypothetical protein